MLAKYGDQVRALYGYDVSTAYQARPGTGAGQGSPPRVDNRCSAQSVLQVVPVALGHAPVDRHLHPHDLVHHPARRQPATPPGSPSRPIALAGNGGTLPGSCACGAAAGAARRERRPSRRTYRPHGGAAEQEECAHGPHSPFISMYGLRVMRPTCHFMCLQGTGSASEQAAPGRRTCSPSGRRGRA